MPKYREYIDLATVINDLENRGLKYHQVTAFPGLITAYRCVDLIIGVNNLNEFQRPEGSKLQDISLIREKVTSIPYKNIADEQFYTPSGFGAKLPFVTFEERLGSAVGSEVISVETKDPSIFIEAEAAGSPTEFIKPVEIPVIGQIKLRPYPEHIIDLIAEYEKGFLKGEIDFSSRLDHLRHELTADQYTYLQTSNIREWPSKRDLKSNTAANSTTMVERALFLHFPKQLSDETRRSITHFG